MSRTAGAVLVGGASRRMGRTKALVEVAGVPMAAHVAGVLAAAGCDPVLLIGGDPAELAPLGLPVVADRHPGEGPLGGIVTALHATGDLAHDVVDVVVAACDLPDLDVATVRALVDVPLDGDAVVAVAVTDRLEPALARWRRTASTPLATLFATGERALHVAVLGLPHVEVPVTVAALRNVNTPGDLERCEPPDGSSR